MYVLVALTLAIIYLFPRLTKAVPSTLVAIVVVTAIAISGNLHVGTVGDMGTLTQQLPVFLIPSIPVYMGNVDDNFSLLYVACHRRSSRVFAYGEHCRYADRHGKQ